MFTQKWRDHWGLIADPFACEDADKDLILTQIEMSAVHSGFDRVFGDPAAPSPGIVFGEKGSGKSGLRLMMRRRLEAHNQAHRDRAVFDVEYIDFNGYIEALGRTVGGRRSGVTSSPEVLGSWEISDHLDSILSLGVTQLVDGLLDGSHKAELSHKQQIDLALLTALYHDSKTHTTSDALSGLARSAGLAVMRGGSGALQRVALSALGVLLAVSPHIVPRFDELSDLSFLAEHRPVCYGVGLALAVLPWLVAAARDAARARQARRADRSVRVLHADHEPLARLLRTLDSKERADLVLPEGNDEASRYELLQRFLGLLDAAGYQGLYVLMDRVDEPTLLCDSPARMQEFVKRILDIKLLQHPRLGLKLFLPIEMESLWRNASSDELKRMRLDKSNLLAELKWTGRELYEIANQRLAACKTSASPVQNLSELLGDDLDLDYVLETFAALGTPRYAFGFLSEVFLQYVKDLPNDLADDHEAWRLPRAAFDVVRASWIDRAGLLRRTLN